MAMLQTLDRGLKALFFIANSENGKSVAELASELEIDRAVAYRIANTLEHNGLVSRKMGGRLFLGASVVGLESSFEPQLRQLVRPLLKELARKTNATAFITIAQNEEGVAISVCEPDAALLRVGYKVGSRHPINTGAAGIAILAARPDSANDSPEICEARKAGYSITRGALQKGAVGVARALSRIERNTGPFEASIGVVAMEDLDINNAISSVLDCVQKADHLLSN